MAQINNYTHESDSTIILYLRNTCVTTNIENLGKIVINKELFRRSGRI